MNVDRPSAAARCLLIASVALSLGFLLPLTGAYAHGVADGDKGYIQDSQGALVVPFIYLGAKHMVTGYDHLLFLLGVVFYLHRLRSVATYVSLFAVGHSLTLIVGVLAKVSVSAFLVDAIIGLSVVYKALDNMGAYRRWFGVQPNTKAATLGFGLVHGFGLATKLQDFEMSPDGLFTNLVSFNVGVELGQVLGLTFILIGMGFWKRTDGFSRSAYTANVVIMAAGFVLMGLQLVGYFLIG